MNKELAKAIVRSFSQSASAALISSFKESDWRSVGTWLDTSGIALYFLHQLKELHIEDSIPRAVLAGLEVKARQHERQVNEQFEEFTATVDLLRRNRIPFAVQKGYSLIPDYSPDPKLRLQLDFDLLVETEAVSACNQLLFARGYQLINQITNCCHHEWQLRKGETGIPKLADLYKPKGEFTIEVHSKLAPAVPQVVTSKQVRGVTFPALPKTEVFVEQCLHVFRHLRGEQTRLSWILEYSNFVRCHPKDEDFWSKIKIHCDEDPAFACAFVCLHSLATHLFGESAPQRFADLNGKYATDGVRKWLSRYAWKVALAEFPGTKLYLLLERELIENQQEWQRMARKAIIPLHRPPRVMASTQIVSRKKYSQGRLRHVIARAIFHAREACRVSYELVRWKFS